MALKNSKTGSLPVSEIYTFMKEHFPYFKVRGPSLAWGCWSRSGLSYCQNPGPGPGATPGHPFKPPVVSIGTVHTVRGKEIQKGMGASELGSDEGTSSPGIRGSRGGGWREEGLT